MCGIIGYVGKRASASLLLEGLRRLEYRGYDSAGVAVLNGVGLQLRKKTGGIDEGLARLLEEQPVAGHLGIGHTRWATHGPPSDTNSHPHLDRSGDIAVVHNGVIENCDRLRDKLVSSGHTFRSGTDTEVLAHLIGDYYQKHRATDSSGSWGERPGESAQLPATDSRGASPHSPGNGSHPLARAVCDALREV